MDATTDRLALPGDAQPIAQNLVAALADAAAAPTALERARVIQQHALPELEKLRLHLGRARAEAALDASLSGATFAGIARELDLSRAMAQKLVEDGRSVAASGVWPPERS